MVVKKSMTKKKKIDLTKAKKKYKQVQKWIQNNINPDVYRGTYTGFDPLGQSFELKSIDAEAGGVSSKKTSKKKKPVVETSSDGRTIIIKL